MYRSIYLQYLSIYSSIHIHLSIYSSLDILCINLNEYSGFSVPKPQEVGEKQNRKPAWPESSLGHVTSGQPKKTFQKGGPWDFFFKYVVFFFNLTLFVSLVCNKFETCWFQLGFASNDQRDQSVHLYYARCSTIFLKTPKHTKTMSITSSSSSSSTSSSTPIPPQPNQQPPTVWTHVFLPKRYHHSLHHPSLSKANTKGATVRRSVGIGTLRRDMEPMWNRWQSNSVLRPCTLYLPCCT